MKKLSAVALDITGSVLVTGNSYQNMKAFFETLESPFFTARTYDKTKKKYIYPAIQEKYGELTEWVREKLIDTVQNEGPLNIIGDGCYDSRGRCALRCKYVLMDAKHKFVVDHVIVRRASDEHNYDMEKTGFMTVFPRFLSFMSQACGPNSVCSFTSDRSKSIATVMKTKFFEVEHYFDHWHFIRCIVLDLLKKRNQKQFKPIVDWLRSFTNHIYYSISSSDGNGDLAKEKLLSFFNHVVDKHENFEARLQRLEKKLKCFQNETWFNFRVFSSCEHGDIDEFVESCPAFLSLSSKKDVKALNAVHSVISKGDRLEDIKKVSPHFATSSVESYNARALRYTSKDLFYSDKGFEIRTMLSVIDWNMKQRDEIEGRREVLNEKSYFNKTSKRKSLKYLKTRADYSWRKEIVRNAHKIREKEDEAASTEEEIEEKSESEEEAETDDPDSLWDLLEPCSDDEMDKNQESDEESVFE
ncbi:unnamed protein product [Caenorhabditis brenneri]